MVDLFGIVAVVQQSLERGDQEAKVVGVPEVEDHAAIGVGTKMQANARGKPRLFGNNNLGAQEHAGIGCDGDRVHEFTSLRGHGVIERGT